jgi:para-nitrobenzyl esterase
MMILACAGQARAAGPTVDTVYGPVRGVQAQGLRAFKGIDYAAAPVGALRWRPPSAPARWTAPRDAVAFGPSCPQSDPHDFFARGGGAEDCLTLNVFTPDPPGRASPVMVWIHGGNLEEGESRDYDPSWLVKTGDVVVVTINYRLGVLGFLAQKSLDGEGHQAANYGLMDQQFALAWVHDNIAAFGGDPRNVTIFGESAGGNSVYAHMVAPGSRGLFHKGIIESGGYEPVYPSLAAAEALGQDFAKRAGCADQSAACLRRLPVARILAAQADHKAGLIEDGSVLPRSPARAFPSGQFNKVPVISGTNLDEASLFVVFVEKRFGTAPDAAQYRAILKSFYAGDAAKVMAEYPLARYASPAMALSAAATASMFDCRGLRIYDWLAPFVPVYVYEFADRTAPDYMPPVGFALGAAHTFELPFLFTDYHGALGTLHTLDPAQKKLSAFMLGAWTRFAHTGEPGGAWPRFTLPGQRVLRLDLGHPAPITDYAAEHDCAFWDRVQGK